VHPRLLAVGFFGQRAVAAEKVEVPGQERQGTRPPALVVLEVVAEQLDEAPEDGEALLGRRQPRLPLADLAEQPWLHEGIRDKG
jgi:hypothetical protein